MANISKTSHAASHAITHPYHLVALSPWPIVGSFSLLLLAVGAVLLMHGNHFGYVALPCGLVAVISLMAVWWRDVIKEARVDHAHTAAVQMGLRIGMALFILSEVMFFFAFFWSFFKAALSPEAILEGAWPIAEGIWPPKGIIPFDPWDLPLTNTLTLLLSGCTVTWAHYAIRENKQQDAVLALKLSVGLGLLFTCLQAIEYHHAPFLFRDGIYPSNFFMATGFHGLHVFIGTIFLAVCMVRAKRGHFTPEHHLGFEFAAWYWHFVDVVWLFLFVFVYIIGR
jgi:cytochrome c oxidase subunit 3